MDFDTGRMDFKKYMFFGCLVAVFCGGMIVIFATPSKSKNKNNETSDVVLNLELPDATDVQLIDDKRDAYEQEAH